mmetsp:Transcript_30810/g.89542  ORF Transcript_30810/g.89542 Transcript_30810/m.89542 type:complete len:215 (+) Transcript_30810:453-1097(+)
MHRPHRGTGGAQHGARGVVPADAQAPPRGRGRARVGELADGQAHAQSKHWRCAEGSPNVPPGIGDARPVRAALQDYALRRALRHANIRPRHRRPPDRVHVCAEPDRVRSPRARPVLDYLRGRVQARWRHGHRGIRRGHARVAAPLEHGPQGLEGLVGLARHGFRGAHPPDHGRGLLPGGSGHLVDAQALAPAGDQGEVRLCEPRPGRENDGAAV